MFRYLEETGWLRKLINGILFVAVIAVAVVFLKPNSIHFEINSTDTSFTLSYTNLYSVEIPYEEINDISTTDQMDFGTLVDGGTSNNIMYGTRMNDTFGEYRLIVDLDVTNYIVISTASGDIVVNYADAESTDSLYQAIESLIQSYQS